MKTCRTVQEKLVAGERLSAAEAGHLSSCADCRAMQKLHGWLLSEGELVREAQASAERRRPPRRFPVRLAWGTALAGALLAALYFFRPAPDISRVAGDLSSLLDEVYQVTEAAGASGEEDALPGWLSVEMEAQDPAGEDLAWL